MANLSFHVRIISNLAIKSNSYMRMAAPVSMIPCRADEIGNAMGQVSKNGTRNGTKRQRSKMKKSIKSIG
jgi:hypothetical protein